MADAGLLSKENIALLESHDYHYILGARIKNESQQVREEILALDLADAQSAVITKSSGQRLIISYSASRAGKDAFNRERGIKKLQEKIKSGKLTKSGINNRGYNKFLILGQKVDVCIDQAKIDADKSWDGLKGYLTNTSLSKEEVMSQYKDLWQIEQAFRVTKSELEVRPIFHRVRRRIEAHICIAFVAYNVYKELERLLKEKQSEISAVRAIDIAKSIYKVEVRHPVNRELFTRIIITTQEQKKLAEMFGF